MPEEFDTIEPEVDETESEEPEVEESEEELDVDLDVPPKQPQRREVPRPTPPTRDLHADRINQLERELYAQKYAMEMLRGQSQPQTQHKPLTDKDLTTPEAWVQYIRQETQRAQQEAQWGANAQATSVASVAQARGLFSRESLGEGYDYDSVVNQYIAPIESQDPAFAQVISIQRDPGKARMFLGLMMRLAELNNGDSVKTAKAMISAMGASQAGVQNLKKSINQAVKRGADRVGGQKGFSPNVKSAKDVWGMSDKDFKKWDESMDI